MKTDISSIDIETYVDHEDDTGILVAERIIETYTDGSASIQTLYTFFDYDEIERLRKTAT